MSAFRDTTIGDRITWPAHTTIDRNGQRIELPAGSGIVIDRWRNRTHNITGVVANTGPKTPAARPADGHHYVIAASCYACHRPADEHGERCRADAARRSRRTILARWHWTRIPDHFIGWILTSADDRTIGSVTRVPDVEVPDAEQRGAYRWHPYTADGHPLTARPLATLDEARQAVHEHYRLPANCVSWAAFAYGIATVPNDAKLYVPQHAAPDAHDHPHDEPDDECDGHDRERTALPVRADALVFSGALPF
ncbi:hypothetical protein AB0H83_45805 [Dactylosporangium sp. NPDC050688]|uniref:hypothetical protein n=1 Tax=Dactylosporangium sp. NPDC050688 TaxID=3157217 RepID=UPI0033F170B1